MSATHPKIFTEPFRLAVFGTVNRLRSGNDVDERDSAVTTSPIVNTAVSRLETPIQRRFTDGTLRSIIDVETARSPLCAGGRPDFHSTTQSCDFDR